ncbi:MAG: Lrp/AsnC family transcriptional regulator [Propionivibrio sp.]
MHDTTADSAFQASLGLHLLNDFQQDFPLCPAPFAELAVKLGVAETAVLRKLEQLRREGKIARVGAVFAPKRIGASTLAAMAVPADKLAAVAEAINRFPEVTHNYEREHRYNHWFVVTAGSEGRLQAALGAIERSTGYPLLRLPLLREYLFDPEPSQDVSAAVSAQPTVLDEIERRLVMALQEGLPLFIRPFSVLASRVGCEEHDVLERIRRWSAEGVIKRFGVVVRPQEIDSHGDALLVHDVPDADVVRLGSLLARMPGVSLCYQRPRVLPEWPYNLFCSIRGADRDEVGKKVADLRQSLGLGECPFDLLFATGHPPRSA